MTPFKRVKPALGTLFEISLKNITMDLGYNLTNEAFEEVYELESIFNIFDPESEISWINRGPLGIPLNLSSELSTVLNFGAQVEELSRGAFKLIPSTEKGLYELGNNFVIRRTSHPFDLGGIAKGYIVDRIFESLKLKAPEAHILVNAGGDLRCSTAEDIELRVPSIMPGGDDKHFAISNFHGAIATSSLIHSDQQSGRAAAHYHALLTQDIFVEERATTVTVGARTCIIADALTKVFLFGETSELQLASLNPLFNLKFDSHGRSL